MADQLSIRCDVHKGYDSLYLGISEKNKAKQVQFLCKKCIIKGQNQDKILIDLEQILNIQDNEIIQNWPPVDSPNLLDDIENAIRLEDQSSEMIQKLDICIQEIKRTINTKIDEYHKEILRLMKTQSSDLLMRQYDAIVDKQQLRECVLQLKSKADETRLKDYIQSKFKDIEKNTDILYDTLTQHNKCKEYLNKYQCLNDRVSSFFQEVNLEDFTEELLETSIQKIKKNQKRKQKDSNSCDDNYDCEQMLMDSKYYGSIPDSLKRYLLEVANTQLKSINRKITFQWNTYQELADGLFYDNQSMTLIFSQGFKIPNKIHYEDIKHYLMSNQNKDGWWIKINKWVSNSGEMWSGGSFGNKMKSLIDPNELRPRCVLSDMDQFRLYDTAMSVYSDITMEMWKAEG